MRATLLTLLSIAIAACDGPPRSASTTDPVPPGSAGQPGAVAPVDSVALRLAAGDPHTPSTSYPQSGAQASLTDAALDSLADWLVAELQLAATPVLFTSWRYDSADFKPGDADWTEVDDWAPCWSLRSERPRAGAVLRELVTFFPPTSMEGAPDSSRIAPTTGCRLGNVSIAIPVDDPDSAAHWLARIDRALDRAFGVRRPILPAPTTVFGEFVDTTFRQRGELIVLADLDRQQGHYDGERQFLIFQSIGPAAKPLFPPASHGNGSWPAAFSPSGRSTERIRWAASSAGIPQTKVDPLLALLDERDEYQGSDQQAPEGVHPLLTFARELRTAPVDQRMAGWLILSAIDGTTFTIYTPERWLAESLQAIVPPLPPGVPAVDGRLDGGRWSRAVLDSAQSPVMVDSAFTQMLRSAIPASFDGECRGAAAYAGSGALAYLRRVPSGRMAGMAHRVLFDVFADSIADVGYNETPDPRWRSEALTHLLAGGYGGAGEPAFGRMARAWRLRAGLPLKRVWYRCSPGE